MKGYDTALIRMVISDLSKKHNWNYEDVLEKFYSSNVCKGLSDEKTGMFTFSPREIIELFEQEAGITRWQENLFEDMTIEEIYNNAAKLRDKNKKKSLK